MTMNNTPYASTIDTPGNGPYAAAALVIHETGLVLTVSRKYDMLDLGLPGGKLEPNQTFSEACIAELLQETGLNVVKLKEVYGDYCGNPAKHIVHWNQVFLCKAEGKIHTEEKGRVVWVNPMRLIHYPGGTRLNSFGDFNQRMFERCKQVGPIFTKDWLTTIELDPEHVEMDPYPHDYFVDQSGTFCQHS